MKECIREKIALHNSMSKNYIINGAVVILSVVVFLVGGINQVQAGLFSKCALNVYLSAWKSCLYSNPGNALLCRCEALLAEGDCFDNNCGGNVLYCRYLRGQTEKACRPYSVDLTVTVPSEKKEIKRGGFTIINQRPPRRPQQSPPEKPSPPSPPLTDEDKEAQKKRNEYCARCENTAKLECQETYKKNYNEDLFTKECQKDPKIRAKKDECLQIENPELNDRCMFTYKGMLNNCINTKKADVYRERKECLAKIENNKKACLKDGNFPDCAT